MQFFMFQRYEKSRQPFCAQPIHARLIPDCKDSLHFELEVKLEVKTAIIDL